MGGRLECQGRNLYITSFSVSTFLHHQRATPLFTLHTLPIPPVYLPISLQYLIQHQRYAPQIFFFFFFASRRRFYSPTFYGRYCFSHSLQPSLSLILPVLRFRINSTLHLQFLSPTSPNTSYSIFYAKPGDPSKKKDDPLLSQHFLTFTNL